MSQRFLVYPILFLAFTQLIPLLGGERRWYVAQISQLLVTLLACCGAIYFSEDSIWVSIAWALFAAFVIAPAVLASLAAGKEVSGYWRGAAMFRQLAGWVAWGRTGRLYRRYAAALRLVARGQTEEALLALDQLATQPMPLMICGVVRIWKLSLLVALRQWGRTVAFYESVHDWGTLGQAMQARLFVARALAEAGQIERAQRSLQFVALSPRTLGARQTQLWATRVCVAALAGDAASVDFLLRQREYVRRSRRFARFAAYWRGRCALARGDREAAMQGLTRALGLTPMKNHLWRDAITQHLRRAQTEELPKQWVAQDMAYAHGQDLLQRAEKDTAVWRALMYMGRPEPVTLVLLVILAVVYLIGDVFLSSDLQEKFLLWAGNSSATVQQGEWWRVFTALFLHANWLHLTMNGAGLWIFGTAVEKAMGRWRFLMVFLLAGALGNMASAFVAHYDVAIGASGGIFGVIGAFAVAVWRLRSPMYHTLRRRLLVVLALMVATDFTIGGLEPHVDNLAHVGGFVSGILIAMLLYRRRMAVGSPAQS
jgi:membrane associated rhomboid family serine protease